MKTLMVTVADDRFGRKGGLYTATQSKIETIFRNNPGFGIADFRMWDWADISGSDFYVQHKTLLDHPDPAKNGRLYKACAIYEGLKELEEGDFLVYNDCSPELWQFLQPNSKIEPKYNLDVAKSLCVSNGGILTAHVKWNFNTHVNKGEIGYHTHENFTTERCLNRMGMQAYRYSLQHASGMIILQKSEKTMRFVEEWIYWNAIDECGCLGPADDAFFWYDEVINNFKIGHRHDQSVSGLLLNKMGNRLVETLDYYERPTNMNPYNFLNFCNTQFRYNFFDSNPGPGPIVHKMISPDGNPDGEWHIVIEDRKDPLPDPNRPK